MEISKKKMFVLAAAEAAEAVAAALRCAAPVPTPVSGIAPAMSMWYDARDVHEMLGGSGSGSDNGNSCDSPYTPYRSDGHDGLTDIGSDLD